MNGHTIHETSSTDSKVRTTLHVSIIDSESESVRVISQNPLNKIKQLLSNSRKKTMALVSNSVYLSNIHFTGYLKPLSFE